MLLAAFARGKGAIDTRLDLLPYPLDHFLAPELSEQPLDLGSCTLPVHTDRVDTATNLTVSAPCKSQSINEWDTGRLVFGPRTEASTGAEEYVTVACFLQWDMYQRTEHCENALECPHQPADLAACDAGLDGAGEVMHERDLRCQLVVVFERQSGDRSLVALILHPAEIPALKVGLVDGTLESAPVDADDAPQALSTADQRY